MISFFNQDIHFQLDQEDRISKWLLDCFLEEKKLVKPEVNIIFTSDDTLLQINKDFLAHDYYTDIITFTLEETDLILEAELYISIDRVKDNAQQMKKSFHDELHRVIIHGILHLCGYGDKTDQEIQIMRNTEDKYLSKL